ncbi:MAG: glycosyltransferase family 2 protein [Kofleriaceae bacterium]
MPALEISVVTPSFNQGRYLSATIESVLAQEGDFSLDYLVIDGGSTDDSVEIIREYEARVKAGVWRPCRFRWVSEKDRGQTDAILKGFARATGEVVAWLNSDDTYLPGALATAAAYFGRDPGLGLLYGKSRFIDEHGREIGAYPTQPFDADRLATFNFIAQPSTFFRARTLADAGGLATELHYAMDYDLWIRMTRRSTPRYVPQYLSTFRLHDESKTMSVAHALANQKETLEVVERHYGWSPLNRVFSYAYQLVRSRIPTRPVPLAMLTVPVAVAEYLRRNRGVRLADMRLVNPSNLRKLFVPPGELYKDY